MSLRLDDQLDRGQLLRLFLSYQRYGALLLVTAAAAGWLATGAVLELLRHGLEIGPALLALAGLIVAAKALPMGIYVLSQWPKKLRATRVGLHRIRQGRFRPESLRRYCEAPCYRVVAAELLRQHGHDAGARRQLLQQYKEDSHQPLFIMKVDPTSQRIDVQGALIANPPPGAPPERTNA